jgi:hypothetical protein
LRISRSAAPDHPSFQREPSRSGGSARSGAGERKTYAVRLSGDASLLDEWISTSTP